MNNNEGERERNWNLVSSDQRALPHSPSQISSGLQSSLAFWLRPCAARYNHQYMLLQCLKASCTSNFPWKFSRPVLEHRWWNSASINAVQPDRSKDREIQFCFHPRAFLWLEDNPPSPPSTSHSGVISNPENTGPCVPTHVAGRLEEPSQLAPIRKLCLLAS